MLITSFQNPHPMKICLVCNEYPPGPHGGVGTFTRVFGRALAGAGHQVRVVGFYDAAYPGADYSEDEGVQVWRLRVPSVKLGWVWSRYRVFSLVKKWARRGEIDIVDGPDHAGVFAGWPKLNVPVVMRAGGSYTYFAHEANLEVRPSTFRIERSSYRRADAWIAKSQYIGDVTQKLFDLNDPDAVLYNPVDLPSDLPEFGQRDPNLVVFSGTMVHKKGIIQLVKAWKDVLSTNPRARLGLFGKDGGAPDGQSMRDYLRGLLSEEERQSVNFAGHVSRAELFAALTAARAAVFPSYAEGFAWAPLEAMACACPTVYSRRGSGPELLEDGVSGLLAEPDDTAEIAGAIRRLLDDDAFAESVSNAGRAKIESTFAIDVLEKRNLEFYQETIDKFRSKTEGRRRVSGDRSMSNLVEGNEDSMVVSKATIDC